MKTIKLFSIVVLGLFGSLAFGNARGLVENSSGINKALLVGVGHGLPGLDIDIENVETIAHDAAYNFDTTILMDEEGTVAAIEEHLTDLASLTGLNGTFMFYFTGHGNVGTIFPEDESMKIEQIRDALEKGREVLGPLARLTMIIDSCHSGSLLDPMRVLGLQSVQPPVNAARIADIMNRGQSRSSYWNKLLIIASTKPDETCLASPEGSYFTNALAEAFETVAASDGTVQEFFEMTRDNTSGSTPTSRFVPESLGGEKLIP